MYRTVLCPLSLILAVVLSMVFFPQAALGGPPLLCHPIEIGHARSLPWGDSEWRAVNKDYDLNRLVEDTLGLLTPETPVLVRMETLRRATVYSVWAVNDKKVGYTVTDLKIANQLLERLRARVPEPAVKADKQAAALALFDLGYLAASYRQAGHVSPSAKLASDVDGYGMIVKAIGLRGSDPEMEFAAALVSLDPPRVTHRAHLQKAVAGAIDGSLLARNLVSHFSNIGKTIAELRTNIAAAKN